MEVNSDLLLSNNIDGIDVYQWMMRRREEVNYKDMDFHDPDAPDFWSELNNEICRYGISAVVDKMVNDLWLYCFQDEYAILKSIVCLIIPVFITFRMPNLIVAIIMMISMLRVFICLWCEI